MLSTSSYSNVYGGTPAMKIFIENKYTEWYYNIITKAKLRSVNNEYTENHHIIPKCMSGKEGDNLVILTAREHFVCHRLLVKMTKNVYKSKLYHALWCMSQNNMSTKHKPNSRIYEFIKREYIKHMKSQSGKDNNFYGRKHSEETKRKMSEKALGRKPSEDTKRKMSEAQIGKHGRKHSEGTKKKISKSKLAYYKNNKVSEDIKKKISNSIKQHWATRRQKHK